MPVKQSCPWSSPIIRWAGSKRKLLPVLVASIPSHFRTYFEPFAGSACLFFAIKPPVAVLGDINQDLVQTYHTVRLHPWLVARKLLTLSKTADTYYDIRARLPTEVDLINRATYFIFLNRCCFNGVYRTNRKGHFNVPYGIRTGDFPSSRAFYRCSVALRAAKIRAVDFESCVQSADAGDFVYLDPPYSTAERQRYGEYGYGSFQPPDLERLVIKLRELDSRGVRFLLSYSHFPRRLVVDTGWTCRKLSVRRHVAGFAKHRGYVSEVLVSNFSPSDADSKSHAD